MRELKFRVWDESENKMLFPMSFQSGVGVSIPNEYLSHKDSEIFLRCRYKTQLMQFTGLFDRDGKEICDGDILEFDRAEWGGDDNIFLVTWDSVDGGWDTGGANSECSYWKKIVGNIYETPNLLTKISA
jgi:uncharacterized phage protein (TIGR01671 family)